MTAGLGSSRASLAAQVALCALVAEALVRGAQLGALFFGACLTLEWDQRRSPRWHVGRLLPLLFAALYLVLGVLGAWARLALPEDP